MAAVESCTALCCPAHQTRFGASVKTDEDPLHGQLQRQCLLLRKKNISKKRAALERFLYAEYSSPIEHYAEIISRRKQHSKKRKLTKKHRTAIMASDGAVSIEFDEATIARRELISVELTLHKLHAHKAKLLRQLESIRADRIKSEQIFMRGDSSQHTEAGMYDRLGNRSCATHDVKIADASLNEHAVYSNQFHAWSATQSMKSPLQCNFLSRSILNSTHEAVNRLSALPLSPSSPINAKENNDPSFQEIFDLISQPFVDHKSTANGASNDFLPDSSETSKLVSFNNHKDHIEDSVCVKADNPLREISSNDLHSKAKDRCCNFSKEPACTDVCCFSPKSMPHIHKKHICVGGMPAAYQPAQLSPNLSNDRCLCNNIQCSDSNAFRDYNKEYTSNMDNYTYFKRDKTHPRLHTEDVLSARFDYQQSPASCMNIYQTSHNSNNNAFIAVSNDELFLPHPSKLMFDLTNDDDLNHAETLQSCEQQQNPIQLDDGFDADDANNLPSDMLTQRYSTDSENAHAPIGICSCICHTDFETLNDNILIHIAQYYGLKIGSRVQLLMEFQSIIKSMHDLLCCNCYHSIISPVSTISRETMQPEITLSKTIILNAHNAYPKAQKSRLEHVAITVFSKELASSCVYDSTKCDDDLLVRQYIRHNEGLFTWILLMQPVDLRMLSASVKADVGIKIALPRLREILDKEGISSITGEISSRKKFENKETNN